MLQDLEPKLQVLPEGEALSGRQGEGVRPAIVAAHLLLVDVNTRKMYNLA